MWSSVLTAFRPDIYYLYGVGVRELVGAALELSCIPSAWCYLHDTSSAKWRHGIYGVLQGMLVDQSCGARYLDPVY